MNTLDTTPNGSHYHAIDYSELEWMSETYSRALARLGPRGASMRKVALEHAKIEVEVELIRREVEWGRTR